MIIELTFPPAQNYGGQSTKMIIAHISKTGARRPDSLFFRLPAIS
jgi:hypothetical protein